MPGAKRGPHNRYGCAPKAQRVLRSAQGQVAVLPEGDPAVDADEHAGIVHTLPDAADVCW